MAVKGTVQTPEHIAKRIASRKGYRHSEETKRKMSEAAMGRKCSEETVEKMRIIFSNRSPETRKKMSDSAKTRPPVSEETRRKMSEAGKKRPPINDEMKKRISETLKGHVVTEETRKKISDKNINKIVSEESRKKMSESRKGENNHNWKGGVSYEPYCVLFNVEFKGRVREFFDYKCVECGKTEEETGRKMSVHHCNYSKDACCNEDVIPLFVTLCTGCHTKTTHGDREYYEERYTTLINEKYGGKCYYSKEEYNQIKQEA